MDITGIAKSHQAGIQKTGKKSSKKEWKYRSLVDNILREGDLLVVTELKRFGRNYGEICKEWFRITKEIGADKELCKERNSLYEKQNDLKGQKWKIEKSLK